MAPSRNRPWAVIGDGINVCKSIKRPWTGLAVIAHKPFRCGDIITVYDGGLFNKLHVPPANDYFSALNTHLCSIPMTDFVISGLQVPVTGRGGGSFVNHSAPPGANARLSSIKFPFEFFCGTHSDRVVVIVALRDISPGEEVTSRYPRQTCARLRLDFYESI